MSYVIFGLVCLALLLWHRWDVRRLEEWARHKESFVYMITRRLYDMSLRLDCLKRLLEAAWPGPRVLPPRHLSDPLIVKLLGPEPLDDVADRIAAETIRYTEAKRHPLVVALHEEMDRGHHLVMVQCNGEGAQVAISSELLPCAEEIEPVFRCMAEAVTRTVIRRHLRRARL